MYKLEMPSDREQAARFQKALHDLYFKRLCTLILGQNIKYAKYEGYAHGQTTNRQTNDYV